MQGNQMDQQMQQCIQDCQDCHAICVQTIAYCLQQGGQHVQASHMQSLLDCAQICQTSEDFMLRGSPLHAKVCGVCADACNSCAQSCDQFSNDQQMKACADMCRRCAASCQQMASMA